MASAEDAQEDPKSTVILEGKARLLLPPDRVFYNPVQEFNRDLSVLALRVFVELFKGDARKPHKDRNGKVAEDEEAVTILEALSASGLRSVRYAKEVPGVDAIVANDISAEAVKTIEANVKLNGVEGVVRTSHEDATMFMYKNRHPSKRFAAIDLDPYGCPSIFLDGAVQSVRDGGLLLVTATDMAVLAGNSPETCYCKYGGVSLKTRACHEQALRILLQCIESHANRYGRYTQPMLSISADFYIRVFVRIFTGPLQCKLSSSKVSMVFKCGGCEAFTLQPLGGIRPNPTPKDPNRTNTYLPAVASIGSTCEHCNHKLSLGGPLWSAPLHDRTFVEKMLTIVVNEPDSFATSKRIEGLLLMVSEELPDVPLYYAADKLCSKLHLSTIPMLAMRSAIMNGGYRVSYSHALKTSVKTDAPISFLWDVLRTWEKLHPVKRERLVEGTPAHSILTKETTTTIDFTERSDANPISRKNGFLRFQYNPTPFWGPGTRSSARVGEDKMSKSRKNQNKNSNKSEKFLKRERSVEEDCGNKRLMIAE